MDDNNLFEKSKKIIGEFDKNDKNIQPGYMNGI